MRIETTGFSLKYTLEAGQCFGWKTLNQGYIGCIKDTAYFLKQSGPILNVRAWQNKDAVTYEITETTKEADMVLSTLRHYLNIDCDYIYIIEEISKDNYIKEAVGKYYGLRLVKQPHLECAISFILSGNNNVKRVQKAYHLICEKFGERIYIEDFGIDVFTFPSLTSLRNGSEDDFIKCNAGYRAKYITQFIAKTSSKTLDNLEALPYLDAKNYFIGFLGIGEKIADCILLYSYKLDQIYPTDVWVKRFTNELYIKETKVNEKIIREFGMDYFGEYAGWAQLFLYIFYREKQKFESAKQI